MFACAIRDTGRVPNNPINNTFFQFISNLYFLVRKLDHHRGDLLQLVGLVVGDIGIDVKNLHAFAPSGPGKDGFGPGVQFVALHHHGGLSGNLELELAHREVQIKIEVLQHGADRCDLQVLPWHFDASGLSTDGSTRSWNVLDTELAPGGNCLSIWKGTRSGNGHFPTGSGRSEERRVGKECRSRWAQGE